MGVGSDFSQLVEVSLSNTCRRPDPHSAGMILEGRELAGATSWRTWKEGRDWRLAPIEVRRDA